MREAAHRLSEPTSGPWVGDNNVEAIGSRLVQGWRRPRVPADRPWLPHVHHYLGTSVLSTVTERLLYMYQRMQCSCCKAVVKFGRRGIPRRLTRPSQRSISTRGRSTRHVEAAASHVELTTLVFKVISELVAMLIYLLRNVSQKTPGPDPLPRPSLILPHLTHPSGSTTHHQYTCCYTPPADSPPSATHCSSTRSAPTPTSPQP